MNEPETERCRYCGARCAPDAWYCLECGEPVRPPAEPASTPEGNRRATIAALLALCLIGGGAGAYGLAHRDGKTAQPETNTALPDDRPPKSTATGAETTTLPTGATGETGVTTGTGTSSSGPPTGRTEQLPDDWRGTGFTVIMNSLSKAEHGQEEARSFGQALTCKAGVLDSSNYPALTPGYWTVYCGTYATRDAAIAAAASQRKAGQPDAYARKVA